jgi:hypothetical protein
LDARLKESIFITETLHQLRYYLLANVDPTLVNNWSVMGDTYTPSRSYYDPSDEYDSLSCPKGTLDIKPDAMTMMMPLLFWMKTLSPGGSARPPKYMMICNVRLEDEFAEQTFDTMDFAVQISKGLYPLLTSKSRPPPPGPKPSPKKKK